MNIIIPMAGSGQRFIDEGYTVHKPALPTIDRRSGKLYPMVVCATLDIPQVAKNGENVIYIDREFHKKDGVEKDILKYYKDAKFITVKNLTDGQASTCFMAKDIINNKEPLLIASCDNGMVMNFKKFENLTKKCDVIAFTFRNDERVCLNQNAYGWLKVDNEDKIIEVSVKKGISNMPINDHAIVGTFWFKEGSMFVNAAMKMFSENDRINNEFYVDQVMKHTLSLGYDTRVFEIDKYIGWGTPKDYENYMSTIKYWSEFVKQEKFFKENSNE